MTHSGSAVYVQCTNYRLFMTLRNVTKRHLGLLFCLCSDIYVALQQSGGFLKSRLKAHGGLAKLYVVEGVAVIGRRLDQSSQTL